MTSLPIPILDFSPFFFRVIATFQLAVGMPYPVFEPAIFFVTGSPVARLYPLVIFCQGVTIKYGQALFHMGILASKCRCQPVFEMSLTTTTLHSCIRAQVRTENTA